MAILTSAAWCKPCHQDATREWRARRDEAAWEEYQKRHDAHVAQLRKWNEAWRKRVEAGKRRKAAYRRERIARSP